MDKGHGRLERRRLAASAALHGYLEWPGAGQVFRIDRRVVLRRTGLLREDVVYGVTSLSPRRADPAALLRLVRQHWAIENRSHWVRDVTFDEDRSQARVGSTPEVMAALRNAAIGVLRSSGHHHIAATCRRLAAQPWAALARLGIQREN